MSRICTLLIAVAACWSKPDKPGAAGDDGGYCPSACKSCADGICHIDSTQNDNVLCPAGMPCVISCSSNFGCHGQLDCGAATSCTINCDNDGSCGFVVDCTQAACTLYCRGANSCFGSNIMDTNATSCTLHCCSGGSTCSGATGMPKPCTKDTTCQ